jgi:hypothetical protein
VSESFFPAVPDRPYDDDDYLPPFDFPQWMGPPWHYQPGIVHETRELGRSDLTVILLDGFQCFEHGFLLRLMVRINDLGRQARLRTYAYLERAHGRDYLDERFAPDGLRWGIQYSDGRKATTQDESPYPDDGDIDNAKVHGPVIAGDSRPVIFMDSWSREFWVWPTPSEGLLHIAVEWPGRGIAETITTLDAGTLRAAALRARPLWPTADDG